MENITTETVTSRCRDSMPALSSSIVESSIVNGESDIFTSMEVDETVNSLNVNRTTSVTRKRKRSRLVRDSIPVLSRSVIESSKNGRLSNDATFTSFEIDETVVSNRATTIVSDASNETVNPTASPEVDSDLRTLVLPKIEFPNDFMHTITTGAVYGQQMAEIEMISDKIKQLQEQLLTESSTLANQGAEIRKLLLQLNEDLCFKRDLLKHITVKDEITDGSRMFKYLSTCNKYVSPVLERQLHRRYDYDDLKFWLKYRIEHFQRNNSTESISNLLQSVNASLPTMPSEDQLLVYSPSLIKLPLFRHQRYCCNWMLWRESQFPRGGILGDDTKLGKTLSMISLIVGQSEKRKDATTEINGAASDTEFRGRTLVVCPAILSKHWENEIKKWTNLRDFMLHFGDRRSTIARDLILPEIVLTTYNVLEEEFKEGGPVSHVNWERIVLDEAHILKDHRSKLFTVCCRLKGTIKWCLTCKPMQNQLEDVFALLKFIGCAPLDDLETFTEFIASKNKSLFRLVLQCLMLRRTKSELNSYCNILGLPEKTSEIVRIQLDVEEMNVYKMLLLYAHVLLAKYLNDLKKKGSYDKNQNEVRDRYLRKAFKMPMKTGLVSVYHICLVILRLRLICVHPFLIDEQLSSESLDITSEKGVLKSKLIKQINDIKINDENDDNTIASSILNRSNPVFNKTRISSKLTAVLNVIRDRVISSGDKAVVVSQFPTALELLAIHLKKRRIKFEMLTDGNQNAKGADIVQAFNDTSNLQVLLASLSSGGLNLCCANHLILLEPHWNPELESQAEDRVFGIGQNKPVRIYRFICPATIEERIEDLQRKKRVIAQQAKIGNLKSTMKLTIDDIYLLLK